MGEAIPGSCTSIPEGSLGFLKMKEDHVPKAILHW